MRTVTKLVAIFLLLHILGGVHSSIHDGFAKVFGTVGSVTNVRTTRLLNQLCNESQDDNSLERDACYGCFFRATTQPSGYPTLLAMATCADVYLNNTDYGHCRVYLRDATNNMDPRASPTIIYCTFLECIRQVNKDSLDALESLTREAAPWSPDAKYAWKKRSHFLSLRKNLSALRGICVVRDENRPGFPNNNGPDPDPIPRRYSYSDPRMRRRGPDNVFQFFINGRKTRPAFRQYDRLYSGEDTMRRPEPDYGRLPGGERYFK